jgi:hypothetical protein
LQKNLGGVFFCFHQDHYKYAFISCRHNLFFHFLEMDCGHSHKSECSYLPVMQSQSLHCSMINSKNNAVIITPL